MSTFHSNEYPLSNSQQNIWSLEQAYPGTSINNICETVRIRGNFDIPLLQECLNRIVASDPGLRTQIRLKEDGTPVQYETAYQECQFPVLDFSSTNQNGLAYWESMKTREAMPLADCPLYAFWILRWGEHEGGVLVKTHHLISDGWSEVDLINRIATTYLSLLNGEEPDLSNRVSYQRHVEAEQAYLASKACERDSRYWKKILQEPCAPVTLKDGSGAEISPVGQRLTFELPDKLNHAINAYCSAGRIAPFLVYYMAVAIYLTRVRNAERLCIGAPVHNRGSLEDRNTTGMFVSTLPFFCRVEEDWSFRDFTEKLGEQWLELLRHQRFPFARILETAREVQPQAGGKLFHLVLSFHNSHAYRNKNTSVYFSGQWHYAGYQAEHICIHLNNIEDENAYTVNYDYLTQLFSKYDIEDFHRHLTNLLSKALEEPDRPVMELPIMDAEEENRVLYTFNRTRRYGFEGTLCQKLEEICRDFADKVAVIENGSRYSYRRLWTDCQELASEIADNAVGKEPVIALMLPKSYALLCAMAAVIASGCAWVITDPKLPAKRLGKILRDSRAAAVLTEGNLREILGGDVLEIPEINALDFLGRGNRQPKRENGSDTHSLAYVVYTSGSTGEPKGVEIEQHSLLNFAEAVQPLYGQGAVLSLCSIGFDAFLLESIVSVLNGQTIVLPEEGDAENPQALAELIRRYAVGFLSVTPSRLTAFLKNPEFLKAAGRLEAVVCGGEAFPSSLLRTLSRCTRARIYNQYGPSETTIGVGTALLNGATRITVGPPMRNCRFYVLDKRRRPLPAGTYGDLYIGGDCVGRGYRKDPGKTAAAFVDNPFEQNERMYRTGDIAAWTEDGQLLLKGREDSQVKLRGQRIELEEISSMLMMHPAVRQAVARLLPIEGQNVLTAWYVARHPVSETELLEFSATYLPEYMIPAAFVEVDEIRLTPNGKVDDRLLPAPVTGKRSGGNLHSETTGKVLKVFQKVLNRPDMAGDEDYFLCGGDSLNALEALADLEEIFQVRLRVADLYACRTAARLAQRLGDSETEEPFAELPRAEERERYPLTPAQLGIYFETQMNPDAVSYNMPCGFRTETVLDPERFCRAVERLGREEPILRSHFQASREGIFQKLDDSQTLSAEIYRDISLEQAKADFVRPFDLSAAPLFRAALWQGKDEKEQAVFLDMHHIIGDAVTAAGLIRKLSILYEERQPEKEQRSFFDYACWYEQNRERVVGEERVFWSEYLKDAPKPADIPVDFPRSGSFDYRGAELELSIEEEGSGQIDAFCKNTGITPFVLFAGAFGIFLSRISGEKSLMIGTPVSSRRGSLLQTASGLFVNTLPLRMQPEDGKEKRAYLEEVQKNLAGLLDHPYTPVDELVSLAGLERMPGQNPLYRAMISMRPIQGDEERFAGGRIEPVPVPAGSAKVDLNLEVYKSGGCYRLRLEYASSLYDRESAALYARAVEAAALELAAEEGGRVADCRAVSARDWYALLKKPWTLRLPFENVPVDARIDEMAELNPKAPAVIFHDRIRTFRELKRDSDALAQALILDGIQGGEPVGLFCTRGYELIVGLLGILKAGGAYVPMLPDFPEKRLQYMAKVSSIRRIVYNQDAGGRLPQGFSQSFLNLSEAVKSGRAFSGRPDRDGEGLCFILFTSGSTGQPKGVRIRHRSVSNLLAVLEEQMAALDGGVLCTTNYIFDIFFTESLAALAFGKYVVMADEEEMVLPWKAAALVERHQVEMFQFTPSRASLFMDNEKFFKAATGISLAVTAGEALDMGLVEKFRRAGIHRILNLYGPTEATVYATMADVTAADRITIGKVLPNCRGYILDEEGTLVIPGARGELYLAGECLAAGYAGREDLTRERFLPDFLNKKERMYRTGDIVRLLPDGRIEYLGRRDHQVKLNGQRIELGEINQKLLECGDVLQAATIVKRDGLIMKLCSFVRPKEEGSLDLEALKNSLARELPAYMIPSQIQALDKMPCTASGKIDLAALEKIEGVRDALEEPSEKMPKPAGETLSERMPEPTGRGPSEKEPEAVGETLSERAPEPVREERSQTECVDTPGTEAGKPAYEQLSKLWEEALGKETVDPEVSFFDQGGTSFAALVLLSGYYDLGLTISLTAFYEKPTLKAQAAMFGISPEAAAAAGSGSAAAYRWKEMPGDGSQGAGISEKQAQGKTAQGKPDGGRTPAAAGNRVEKRSVLLTGATGFFGAHLVKALLDSGCPRIYCAVRGEEPKKRLSDMLIWYFGAGWCMGIGDRIQVIPGDIMEENLGMSEEQLAALERQTAAVIHAAADVRHYASDSSAEEVNCRGTENMARLSRRLSARMVYISTVSLCSEYLKDAPAASAIFSERDFDIGQNWEESVYLRGKYRGEECVRRAAQAGQDVLILRLGRLVGRSSDGLFQKNARTNAFYCLANGIFCLEKISVELADMTFDLTPVDECAKAAAALLKQPGPVYHLFHPEMFAVRDILKSIGRTIPEVERPEFEEHLRELAGRGLGPELGMLIGQYNRICQVPSRISPVCAQTCRELEKVGFSWKPVDPAMVLRFF